MCLSLDRRTYRQRDTGHDVYLCAGQLIQHGVRLWEVRLVRADGQPGAVAGQMPIAWWRTCQEAREGYQERLQALREAGFVRVS
jgi:hypothetical protein